MGSFNTQLAVNLGILDLNNHNLHQACTMEPLDLVCLEKMGLVQQVNGVFQFAPRDQFMLLRSAKLPNPPPRRQVVLPQMPSDRPLRPLHRRPPPIASLQPFGSRYSTWTLVWSRWSFKWLEWPRIWRSTSTTWVSARHSLHGLSSLPPSSVLREVPLPLYLDFALYLLTLGAM